MFCFGFIHKYFIKKWDKNHKKTFDKIIKFEKKKKEIINETNLTQTITALTVENHQVENDETNEKNKNHESSSYVKSDYWIISKISKISVPNKYDESEIEMKIITDEITEAPFSTDLTSTPSSFSKSHPNLSIQ